MRNLLRIQVRSSGPSSFFLRDTTPILSSALLLRRGLDSDHEGMESGYGHRFYAVEGRSSSSSSSTDLPSILLPPPPPPPPSTDSIITTSYNLSSSSLNNSDSSPTLAADTAAGLAADGSVSSSARFWDVLSPVDGLVQLITALHSMTAIPWWMAIVGSTVALRLLVFPVQVMASRNAAKMSRVQPELRLLQKELQAAGGRTNPTAMREMMDKQQALFRRHGVNPVRSLIVPLIQAPVFVSMFFGLRRLAVNEPGLATGGLAWFTDLSLHDPTVMLPVMVSLTMLAGSEYAQLRASAAAQNALPAKVLRWFIRVMAVGLVPLTYTMPAAVHLYWLVSNTFTFGQSVLLQNKAVKTALNIPDVVVDHTATELAKQQAAPVVMDTKALFSQRPARPPPQDKPTASSS